MAQAKLRYTPNSTHCGHLLVARAIVLATHTQREREKEWEREGDKLDSVVRSAGNRKLRLACGSSDQNSAAKLENVCPHRDWQRITPGIGIRSHRSRRCASVVASSACVQNDKSNDLNYAAAAREFPQLLWADLCLTNDQIYLWPCANDNA